MKTTVVIFVLCLTAFSAIGEENRRLIFSDDFGDGLNKEHWLVEMDPLPGSSVDVENGKLVLNTAGGVTVWLNKKLSGNFEIHYTRKVIVNGGKNDRLSDVNQFWMATDPNNDNLFTRQGKFEQYDNLSMYYAGVGGNSNTTTRFRKYLGNGERKLLQEYLGPPYLLQENRQYRIKTVVKDNITRFFLDDRIFFEHQDDQFLKEGYFGFRSTYSHQLIDDFQIYKTE